MKEQPPQRRVCVFCASSSGARIEYRQQAQALGTLLAENRIGLVYGGAHVGLMGVLADAALAAGGEVIGVIPYALIDREIEHRGLTHLIEVTTMHERKARMAEAADAFVALPGGFGTLDEFFEVITWAQLGIHAKPCILLNTGGYYDGLLHFLDSAVTEGFMKPESRALIRLTLDPSEALASILQDWSSRALHSQVQHSLAQHSTVTTTDAIQP
jgi:uncharacterized protein (TIGR00730 family)